MNARRFIVPTLTAAVAVSGLVASIPPASAAVSPSASTADSARFAVDQCRLRLVRVRAKDLQHDQAGADQVSGVIGNSFTDTLTYSLGETPNTLGTGEELFSGSAVVALKVEALGGGAGLTIGSGSVDCQNATRDFVFDNGDATYKVRALVQVLP